jgi:CubicO group peptidase (beta-lactamase class C family)
MMRFDVRPLAYPLAFAFAAVATAAPNSAAQDRQIDLAKLDSIAGAGVKQNRAIGLVAAVVKGNDTILFKAYGKADLEWDVPMHVDAMFEVGSIAKQFAAVAILQLRDAGKLSLDDDITKWLPHPVDAGGAKLSLRRLLSHTSGVNHWQEDDAAIGHITWNPGAPRDSLYRHIKLAPLQYPTGEAQAYNNSAFWLLGLVVEKASGMRYEDYLQQKIFQPLGMTRSMYCDHNANIARRAHGYHMPPTGLRRAIVLPYSLVFAPGAVCSTAADLVTWLKALHGGKVLSPASYTEMTTQAKLNDGTSVRYGMGIKVGENYRGLKIIGHGGTAPGFRADAMWYPDAQMAVVVLMNTSPTSLSPGGVGTALAENILPLPRPTFTFYTGDATELVGKYTLFMGGNQPLGSIDVTQAPNGLSFSINGGRAQPLPWAGGLTFFAQDQVTLSFHRANGDRGPVTELRRDDMGNLARLRKQ